MVNVMAVIGVALAFVVCSPGTTAVRIGQVQVPPPQANGSAKDVVLDCDYSLDAGETPENIVVKWFLNKDTNPSPVYQWITNKIPQALGVLDGRLNLGYRATDQPSTRHRALNIVRPTAELSGEYSCQVSSFQGEDIKSKKFIVYVPEDNLELTQSKATEEGQVRLSCEADGVFPKPELAFIRKEGSGAQRVIEGAQVRVTDRKDGLFDIEADILVDETSLAGGPQLGCRLTLEDTPYLKIAWEDYEARQPTTTAPPPRPLATTSSGGPESPAELPAAEAPDEGVPLESVHRSASGATRLAANAGLSPLLLLAGLSASLWSLPQRVLRGTGTPRTYCC